MLEKIDWTRVNYHCETDAYNNPNGTLVFKLVSRNTIDVFASWYVVFTNKNRWRVVDISGNPVLLSRSNRGKLYRFLTRVDYWADWEEIHDALARQGLDFTFAEELRRELAEGGIEIWNENGELVVGQAMLDTTPVDPKRLKVKLAMMDIVSKIYFRKIEESGSRR